MAQKTQISLGYGLNTADDAYFDERGYLLEDKNLNSKLSVSHFLNDFIRLKADFVYSNYTISQLWSNSPLSVNEEYQRISGSIGPQFRIWKIKDFEFYSGFNLGWHYNSNPEVQKTDFRPVSIYFNYGINPISVSYFVNNFSIDLDTYVGTNMYSNVFIGLGYRF